MPKEFDRSAFEQALDKLRFTEAERLAAYADTASRDHLWMEIEQRRTAAEQSAQERHRRIVDLGTAGSYTELADIARDPTTEPLLEMVSDAARHRAELFLREAERWERSRRRINAQRLAEARKALDGLDLELARGLLARIKSRHLDEEGVVERDRLLLEVSARAMEIESLQSASQRLIEESRPKKPRRWWQRRRD